MPQTDLGGLDMIALCLAGNRSAFLGDLEKCRGNVDAVGTGPERRVDAQHHIPHGAAPEVLRGGGDQRPDFCHALVPGAKGGVQVLDDPVVAFDRFTFFLIGIFVLKFTHDIAILGIRRWRICPAFVQYLI